MKADKSVKISICLFIFAVMDKERSTKLKELLSDVHNWPTHYNFKFIYKSDPEILNQLKLLFPVDTEFKIKHSNKKKFESLNVSYMAQSADEVLDLYQKASKINGVMAL